MVLDPAHREAVLKSSARLSIARPLAGSIRTGVMSASW
jgi:hypothetical protein